MRRSRAARCAGSPPRPSCCCAVAGVAGVAALRSRGTEGLASAEPAGRGGARAARARHRGRSRAPLPASPAARRALVGAAARCRGPDRADPRREGGTRAGARPARPRPDARGSGVRRVRARRFSSSRTPRSCRARSAARSVSVAAARRRRPCANAGERERSSRFWTGRAGSSCRGTTWSGTGRAAGFGSRVRRATWAYGRIATTAPTAELRLFLHLLTEGWYVPRVCGQHPCS